MVAVIAILIVLLGLETYLVVQVFRRLFSFDDIFDGLLDDIDVNLQYFERLQGNALISNAPEIIEVHKSMMIMRDRMKEYSLIIEEARRLPKERRQKEKKNENPNPPVVV